MKNLKSLFLLFLFFSAVASGQDTAIINKSRNATIKIIAYDTASLRSEGTGFFMNDDETVLTCFHIVGEIDTLKHNYSIFKHIYGITCYNDTISFSPVYFTEQKQLTYKPTLDNSRYDFVVLKRTNKRVKKEKQIKYLSAIPGNNIYVGEPVYFSGFPIGLPMLSGEGFISGENGSSMYIQSPVNLGNSGGALLDVSGHVIGMVDFGILQLSRDFDSFYSDYKNASQPATILIQGRRSVPVTGNQLNYDVVRTLHNNFENGIGGAINMSYIYKCIH